MPRMERDPTSSQGTFSNYVEVRGKLLDSSDKCKTKKYNKSENHGELQNKVKLRTIETTSIKKLEEQKPTANKSNYNLDYDRSKES